MRNTLRSVSFPESRKTSDKSPGIVRLPTRNSRSRSGPDIAARGECSDGAASARTFASSKQAAAPNARHATDVLVNGSHEVTIPPKSPAKPVSRTAISRASVVADARRASAINGKKPIPELTKPAIVVVHQHAVFRDCFVRCLEISYEDHDIFAFPSVVEWLDSRARHGAGPAIVIVMMDSSDAAHRSDLGFVETVATNTSVVIVSDIEDVNYILHVLTSGAKGYIPANLPFDVAVEAVRLVKAGGVYIPASSLMLRRNQEERAEKNGKLLTERQMSVVEAVRSGKANKQIAYELSMSEHTVKVHLRHIMRKLNARNRTEVAVLSGHLLSEAPAG